MNEEIEENKSKWELFDKTDHAITERLKVEGGHLYHVSYRLANIASMCFVPDVDLARYQSHLRDAYNQGIKDGTNETLMKYSHLKQDT